MVFFLGGWSRGGGLKHSLETVILSRYRLEWDLFLNVQMSVDIDVGTRVRVRAAAWLLSTQVHPETTFLPILVNVDLQVTLIGGSGTQKYSGKKSRSHFHASFLSSFLVLLNG